MGDIMKTILIGASSDLGVHVDGAKLGPLDLLQNMDEEKILIKQNDKYIKSMDPKDLRKNEDEIKIYNNSLYNIIDNKIKEGYFPITIGGDHSISIASALASSDNNGNIGIIWFDAHTDYNTFSTTETGNIHGLPLAVINGYDKCLSTFFNGNYISPKNTVVVGARSIDKLELNNLKEAGVTIFTTSDIKEMGIEEVVKKAFSIALNNTIGVHVSYDLDLIDPDYAPGVSIPEVNGINKSEALAINTEIMKYKSEIVSYDLVEFNPSRDIDNKTKNIAMSILNETIKEIQNK